MGVECAAHARFVQLNEPQRAPWNTARAASLAAAVAADSAIAGTASAAQHSSVSSGGSRVPRLLRHTAVSAFSSADVPSSCVAHRDIGPPQIGLAPWSALFYTSTCSVTTKKRSSKNEIPEAKIVVATSLAAG